LCCQALGHGGALCTNTLPPCCCQGDIWCTMATFLIQESIILMKHLGKKMINTSVEISLSSIHLCKKSRINCVFRSSPSLQRAEATFLDSTFLSQCTSVFAGWAITKKNAFLPFHFANHVPCI